MRAPNEWVSRCHGRQVRRGRGKTHDVELGDEDESDDGQAEPRARFAEEGAEGQLVDGLALRAPGRPESEVGKADANCGCEHGVRFSSRRPLAKRDSHHEMSVAKPVMAMSQSKTVGPAAARLIYASNPHASTKTTDHNGLPALST